MKKKNVIKVLLLGCILFMLEGCENRSCNVSCEIRSVEQSNACSHYICSNNRNSYIYLETDIAYGIYDYDSQEIMIPFNERTLFHCMAASDDYLVYHKKENEGTLCVYSLVRREQVLQIDHMNVCGMWADDKNVFVAVIDEQAEQYDVGIFTNDNFVWMNSVLEKANPVKQEGEYNYYSYDGYTFVVKKDSQEFEIVYVEKDNFCFSCSPNATYVKSKDCMYAIPQQPDFLPTYPGKFGGIATSMLREIDGTCYFIAQYSKKGYRENPSVDFAQTSLLCKYNLYDESFEVLYESHKGEQIVGFSVEKSDLYIMTVDALYRENMKSKERTKLLDNRFNYEKSRGTYYFEDYKQGLIVLSIDHLAQERGPRFEGYFTY